jgi:D-alanyl-D-alanine carboxypeptidase
MSSWPHEAVLQDMNEFYGNPNGGNGNVDSKWFAENVIPLIPPYDMKFSWGPPVKQLLFHKKCRDAFGEALLNIKKLYGDQKTIEAHRMHLTGGSFMFRLMRGSSSRLSVHSWAAAIDIDPQHNPFPAKWRPGMMPIEAGECFQKAGLIWRGANSDIDPMHVQACEHTWRQ